MALNGRSIRSTRSLTIQTSYCSLNFRSYKKVIFFAIDTVNKPNNSFCLPWNWYDCEDYGQHCASLDRNIYIPQVSHYYIKTAKYRNEKATNFKAKMIIYITSNKDDMSDDRMLVIITEYNPLWIFSSCMITDDKSPTIGEIIMRTIKLRIPDTLQNYNCIAHKLPIARVYMILPDNAFVASHEICFCRSFLPASFANWPVRTFQAELNLLLCHVKAILS